MDDFKHVMRKRHKPIWFSLMEGHKECERCLKPPSRGKPILNVWARVPAPNI